MISLSLYIYIYIYIHYIYIYIYIYIYMCIYALQTHSREVWPQEADRRMIWATDLAWYDSSAGWGLQGPCFGSTLAIGVRFAFWSSLEPLSNTSKRGKIQKMRRDATKRRCAGMRHAASCSDRGLLLLTIRDLKSWTIIYIKLCNMILSYITYL